MSSQTLPRSSTPRWAAVILPTLEFPSNDAQMNNQGHLHQHKKRRKGCTNPDYHYATLESHVSPRFYSCMHNISNRKKHQQQILGEDAAKKRKELKKPLGTGTNCIDWESRPEKGLSIHNRRPRTHGTRVITGRQRCCLKMGRIQGIKKQRWP